MSGRRFEQAAAQSPADCCGAFLTSPGQSLVRELFAVTQRAVVHKSATVSDVIDSTRYLAAIYGAALVEARACNGVDRARARAEVAALFAAALEQAIQFDIDFPINLN